MAFDLAFAGGAIIGNMPKQQERLNHALQDGSGKIYDIIAGPFLVVGRGEEDFASLSKEHQ